MLIWMYASCVPQEIFLLTLKVLSKIVAGDILNLIFLFFKENKNFGITYVWIVCLAK